MLQSLLQRFSSRSKENGTNTLVQPVLVVEMSEIAICYLSVGPNPGEGAPYSLHASGCLLAADYPSISSWHSDAAKQLRKYKLKNSKTIGLLSVNDYQLYQTQSVQADTHADLVAAMRWRLKDLTGGDPMDYTLDVVSMGEAGGRLNQQVLIVAAKNDVIALRVEQLQAIGLKVDALSIYEMSLAHLVTGLLPESSCLASLYVTEKEFIISACEQNRVIMFRRIPKDALALDDQTVSMRIIGEVVRSLDRVGRQFPDLQLDALFVDAGTDTQAYLDMLRQELRISCETLTPYAALTEEVALLFFEQRMNPLAGAALSYTLGTSNINLLSKDKSEEDVKFAFGQIMACASLAAILALGAGGYVRWNESKMQTAHTVALAAHQAELAAIEKQVQAASTPAQDVEGMKQILNSYTTIQNYLASQTSQGDTRFSVWMETLARSIPDGLWLTSIDFSATATGNLSLSGMAKSNERLTSWVENLNKTVALNGRPKFDVLDIKQNAENGYWSFVVKSQGTK